MNKIVKTTNLCKTFGKKHALSDVSVSISENSITGLIGRNGSGKTTLMRILAGKLDKANGEALVFGKEPMDNLAVLNKMVYTYHNVQYDQNLHLKTILFGYEAIFLNFDGTFANKLMRYFDLTGKMKYKSLSQGMASIFNFLCALSCRAPLTMLDEPVLGMDVTVRKSAYEILLRDYTEHPRTIIVSSHLLSELESILSDILLIDNGRVVLNNSVDDIRQSAYRIDGTPSAIGGYAADKKVIMQKKSELSSFAVIYEQCTEAVIESAKKQGLTVSPVRPEELCVFLTQQNKEAELECLW
ncbi:MAG: ABC transporter ATP-binding protein [Defluviitaleaceae bacterium]|nr:ABC transporter ATP-binding protein [Defluviitaleaceae bacterium]